MIAEFPLPRATALPLFVLGVSAASLAFALFAQFGLGLEPCILCLYQRVPFVVAGALALLALVAWRRAPGPEVLMALAGTAFLVGAAIAVYHVGVEQKWWASSCSGQGMGTMSLGDLKAALSQKPPKPCDEVDWTVFGISMATWNVPFSGLLGIGTLAAALGLRKSRG